MMDLYISPLYIGLHALMFVMLSLFVVKARAKYQVTFGTGNNEDFLRIVRVQMNFAEYVPLALLGLVILEAIGSYIILLHLLGGALFFGRILHAWGLHKTSSVSPARVVGTVLTITVLLIEGIALVYHGLTFGAY